MAIAKDKGRIVKYGGGVLKVKEVTDAGAELGTPATAVDLGYIVDTELTDETVIEDISDETGEAVASLPGVRTVKLTGLLLQTDFELLDFLRDSTSAKFYQVYYKMSRTGEMDGKTQELFGGICKIRPMLRVKAGDKKVPFEITMLNNDVALSLTGRTSAFGSAADTPTIAANKSYEIVETTPA
jgi:hypothetical protein